MKLAILLTGTIRPFVKNGSFSVDERMKMYTSTLQYYADTIGKQYPIVFVENSDVSLSFWSKLFENKLDLEVLQFCSKKSFASEGFDKEKGKGYNEFLMIKKGVQASEKLKNCTHFLKITGRYSMLNIRKIIKEIEDRADDKLFFADIKDTKIYQLIGRKNTDSGRWADSRYFVAEIAFYKNQMLDFYQQMDDIKGRNAESCLFDLYEANKDNERFLFRYRNQVQFDGQCGLVTSHYHERYNSPKAKLKNKVRGLLRKLFPNIWF